MNRIFSWLMSLAALPFELADRALDCWGDDDE